MPTSYTICNLCDASCGLEVEHRDGQVLAIRGDRHDPFSQGHLCPKGFSQAEIYHDPDRLRAPVRRVGSSWEAISWDDALDEIGRRIVALQRAHGHDAVALYFGNPVGHRHGTLLALIPFVKWLRTRNIFSANSLDAFPRTLVSCLLYGNQALLPVPDLDRTRLLVVLGANPVISNGSIMSAPDCRGRLKALKARGGRLIVIDPRRTETAELADVHHFIRPGTDALLLLALIHLLFTEDRVRLGALEGLVDGLDALRAIAARFPPQRVAAAVGIDADAITALARELATPDGAVCYGRMGTCTQAFGSLASWAIDMVNLLTGNLDREGGAMFNTPAVDLPGLARLLGQTGAFGRQRSRVSGYPDFNGEFPVAAFAEEIETPGDGQIRGLITLAGNPVLSAPNGRRIEKALQGLEFMVSIDLYLNETTRLADIVLPVPAPLESDHYPVLELAMAVRNVAHFGEAVFPRPPEVRDDWVVLLDLIDAIGRHRGPFSGALGRAGATIGKRVGPDRAIDALLRFGPHKLSLEKLKESPHGIDLGPLEPRLASLLRRSKRRIGLVPDLIRQDLPRLEALIDAETPRLEGQAADAGADPSDAPLRDLRLISRRTLRSMNSWLHNNPKLVKGKPRCTLMMHPEDAGRLSLEHGGLVRVSSRVGSIDVPLHVTDEVMPGVVSMPYGWGHGREGSRQSVAARYAGSSLNDVADDRLVDRVSGVSVLDGIPVRVCAVVPRPGAP